MRPYFYYSTGRPDRILSTLLRRVSAYTRQTKVSKFKIGITCSPDRRWVEGYRHEYERMIVVYRTTSDKHVRQMERLLVDHNWECGDNVYRGGGGPSGVGPYYLYIVVGKAR